MSRTTNETTYNLHGLLTIETAKAIRMKVTSINTAPLKDWCGKDEITEWFPFSQVTKIIRNPHGDDTLVVKEWILDQKGLIKTAQQEQNKEVYIEKRNSKEATKPADYFDDMDDDIPF